MQIIWLSGFRALKGGSPASIILNIYKKILLPPIDSLAETVCTA